MFGLLQVELVHERDHLPAMVAGTVEAGASASAAVAWTPRRACWCKVTFACSSSAVKPRRIVQDGAMLGRPCPAMFLLRGPQLRLLHQAHVPGAFRVAHVHQRGAERRETALRGGPARSPARASGGPRCGLWPTGHRPRTDRRSFHLVVEWITVLKIPITLPIPGRPESTCEFIHLT